MSTAAMAIEEILLASLVRGRTTFLPKGGKEWTLVVLSFLLGGAGVFLAVLGLLRFLEGRYPPDLAALVCAGAVLAAAFLAAACCRRRKAPVAQDGLEKTLHLLIKTLYAELEGPVQENPKVAVLLAAVAGFLALRRNDSF
jgi:hypothetical protein